MKTKNKNPFYLVKDKKINEVIKVYFQFNHLKQLYRQGWLKFLPKKETETVADHNFGVLVLALLLVNQYYPNLNLRKVLEMIIVHETGEIYVGDTVDHDRKTLTEKYKKEKQAVDLVFKKLINKERYLKLWQEYEERKSPEARLVKQIDYFEMALQAFIYEKQYSVRIDNFFQFTKKHLKDKKLLEIFKQLVSLR